MSFVVISLDFEMRWGVHDVYGCNFEAYRENVENIPDVVPYTLELFAERNMKATWATVGAVGLENWGEYFDRAPPAPAYMNPGLSINPKYAELDPEGKLHFAANLIRQIIKTPGQELGSHSFSHAYFREPGVTEEDFLREMKAVEELWGTRFNVVPRSFVFPRNQSAFQHLMEKTSIRIWRENEAAWFFDQTTARTNTFYPRLLRIAESGAPWVRRASYMEKAVTRSGLFVRFNLPEPLWKLHMQRVKNELKFILPHQVFHIWWHPENLGVNLPRSKARLSHLLDIVAESCASGIVVSANMGQLANYRVRCS